MPSKILYCIQAKQPENHLFSVTLQLDLAESQLLTFSLPNWIPGSYLIRDFAKNLMQLMVKIEGVSTPMIQLDKSTWSVQGRPGTLVLSYEVFAWDLSVRGAHLDQTHGFFNGTSVFIQANDFPDLPCIVEIAAPLEPKYATWQVMTALPALQQSGAFGKYQAVNYDELIDSPVEMGTFSKVTFKACGIEHDVAVTGVHDCDLSRLANDLKRVCEYQLNFFGAPYPMKRYVFLITVLEEGFGGLEHRASTALICKRDELPLAQMEGVTEAYRNFLVLASHEYFHTWMVKRIKPEVFLPYQLERESYTVQLWIFEGFTRYYESLCLVRSGLITPNEYLQELSETLTLLNRHPGRSVQSLAASSFNAWTTFYQASANAPNAIVSYYTKGAVLAFLLDMICRLKFNNELSLDWFVLELWEQYGRRGIGLPETAFESLFSARLNEDYSQFFADYLYGVKELPVLSYCEKMGLDVQVRHQLTPEDRGGYQPSAPLKRAYLGMQGSLDATGFKVRSVINNSPAETAGIAPGDTLISFGQIKWPKDWQARLDRFLPDDTLICLGFRRDELMTFHIVIQFGEPDTIGLKLKETNDRDIKIRLNNWLGVEID